MGGALHCGRRDVRSARHRWVNARHESHDSSAAFKPIESRGSRSVSHTKRSEPIRDGSSVAGTTYNLDPFFVDVQTIQYNARHRQRDPHHVPHGMGPRDCLRIFDCLRAFDTAWTFDRVCVFDDVCTSESVCTSDCVRASGDVCA